MTTPSPSESTHFDYVLIGSGSGNSFPGPEFAGKTIAYIDRGVGPAEIFGGTCLNVGCIPTKMFVHTANLAHRAEDSARFGISTAFTGADFPAIRDRIFGRIDPISRGGEEYRASHEDNANLTLIHGTARFVGEKEIVVEGADGTRAITGDTFILAAGSRPAMPRISGLEAARPHTSDTVMRMDRLPGSLAILGSGVIALEFAHVFASLGVDVHIIARSSRLLRSWDESVSARMTEVASARYSVHLDTQVLRVERDDAGVALEIAEGAHGAVSTLRVEELLVATGRVPNTDLLAVEAGGLAVDSAGRLRVDEYQRALDPEGRVVEGVFALGDLSSPYQLKHVANHELRIVRHNVLHPEAMRRSDEMPPPAGIFTNPQVASVGMTEAEARAWAAERGREIAVGIQQYAHVAYGWAMELEAPGDFAKVIAADDGTILGAHIVGEEATILLQPLVQAMSLGTTVQQMARGQYWIHPALQEVVENALLQVAEG